MRFLTAILFMLAMTAALPASEVVVAVTTSSADGPYIPGDIITISVVFSGPITVVSTPSPPTLQLNVQSGVATYTGATANQINFSYTVAPGDSAQPLDVHDVNALRRNGGQINDGMGNQANLTLPAPGTPGSLSSGNTLSIETNAAVATIVDITANPASPDASYGIHKTVLIDVYFSEQVFLNSGHGQPHLTLNAVNSISGLPATASYSSGSGSTILEFSYTPITGDAVGDLDVTSFNSPAMQVICGTASAVTSADVTVPTPGLSHSLAFHRNIVVYTTAPLIKNVTSFPTIATYGIGAIIPIQVAFDFNVYVTGVPTLTLSTGTTNTVISYVSGSGTKVLTYSYTVAAGQNTPALDYILTMFSPPQQPFSANSGTIRDIASNDADLASAPMAGDVGSLVPNTAIIIDTTSPVVTGVSAVESGTHGTGAIHVTVTFSEPVTVSGVPSLVLNTGTANDIATYTSGSSTNTLIFTYSILPGDLAAPLDYTSILALSLNGGSIQDVANNQAVLNLPLPGSLNSLATRGITIDTPAAVVSITSPNSPTLPYGINALINIQLNYSKAITVSGGTPTLQLNSGSASSIAVATYSAAASTPTMLDFVYTVNPGDRANPLDILSQNALLLNGATIAGPGPLAAAVTLPTPGTAHALSGAVSLIVNGVSPIILGITSLPTTASYHAGQVILIGIAFNEPVFVTGTPGLTLSVFQGVQHAVATYASGSGTPTLVFSYMVQAGENDSHLDQFNTVLNFNGGSIADAAGNAASGTLPVTGSAASLAGSSHITIDTLAPMVVSVTSPTTTYGIGQTIPITVTFSEAVLVSTTLGTPNLGLNLGHSATYTSGSGTAALVFSYTVLAGDPSEAPLNYASTFALLTNLGTIQDAAGNTADLTLPGLTASTALSASNTTVNTSSPTILSLKSTTANGVYTTGGTINIILTFSTTVNVTGGTPSLALNTTLNQGVATYASGNGSSTLSFTYTIGAGQNSVMLDAAGGSSLQANGATIVDQFGNPANLTVPIGANSGSLASNSRLSVTTTPDIRPPSIVSVTSVTPNGTYNVGDVIRLIVTYSSPVNVIGTPYIVLNDQGGAGSLPVANYSSTATTSNQALAFDYVVSSGNTTPLLDVLASNALKAVGTTTISDPYDTASLVLPAPGAGNSLSASSQLQVDPTAPDGKPPANTLTTSGSSGGGCGVGGGTAVIGMLTLLVMAGRRRNE